MPVTMSKIWPCNAIAGRAVALTTTVCALFFALNVHANTQLETAEEFESRGNYRSAVATYQQYLSADPEKSSATRLARIKLPVLQETIRYGLEAEVIPFLEALDARAIGLTDDALVLLRQMINNNPGGRLTDDAIFMSAYVTMMDHYDFTEAGRILQQLIDSYPDSPYIDTSLYSIAIVNEQLGDVTAAIDTLTLLRDRHNSLSIAGVSWAKDTYLSRFWFERANNRLKHLDDHQNNASQLVSIEQATGDEYQYQAVVQADGREYILQLNQSQTETSVQVVNDSGVPVTPDVKTYRGKVLGIDDSWARISIEGLNLRGFITVNNEQIRLQPRTTGGSLADFHPLLLGDNDGNRATEKDQVLYPPGYQMNLQGINRDNASLNGNNLQDLSVGGLDIGELAGSQPSSTNTDRRIMSDDATTSGSSVSKVARLGVVVDSKFNNYFAGRGVDEALSILNATDGIFRQQLGLALNVDKVILIEDTDDDPMNLGSVTMETMMRNFREYRMDRPEFSESGLATLFSGNKNSDKALGLAWIGSACRTDGFDVSVVSPYYLAELLSTHEIGHTLGAPHDSDTACASQTSNIMWPFLSTGTQQQFSSCSKESMGSLMAATDCHVDAIDLDIDINPLSDTKAEIVITNLSNGLTASGIQIGIESAAGFAGKAASCAYSGQNNVNCRVGSLAPLQAVTVQAELATPLTGDETVRADVTLANAMDVETSNNAIQLNANGETISVIAPGTALPTSQLNLASNNAGKVTTSAGAIHPAGFLILFLLARCRRIFQRFAEPRRIAAPVR